MERVEIVMSEEADVVRRYFDAFNNQDLDAVLASFTDDAEIVSASGIRIHGNAIRERYVFMFETYPDGFCDLTMACGSDGSAAAESTFTGTPVGQSEPVEAKGAELLTIRDGKIRELRDYHSA